MIDLSKINSGPRTEVKKKKILKETELLTARIGELQRIMLAEKDHNLLVILQGMDASGKDGTCASVFSDCTPAGLDVYAFKKPTEKEMNHDFLWRVHKNAPEKGMIKVFNRSHYEDILIQRVHNWISDDRAEKRMDSINAFEKLLEYDNNTTILKFYLHISRERQKEELQERIDIPTKNWKHNENDWKEAERWDEYMNYFHHVFNHSEIPWHIIPADKGWYRNYRVALQVAKTLEAMNLNYPVL